MALELAESLIEQGGFDREAVLRHYIHWYAVRGFDTGPVAEHVFSLISAGTEPALAVEATHTSRRGRTAGCNPAHRAAPVAVAAALPDLAVPLAALRDASLTHFHHLAGDTAAATAVLYRALVRGHPWTTALAVAGIGVPSEQDLTTGGFAPEVVRTAAFFVDRHVDDALPSSPPSGTRVR